MNNEIKYQPILILGLKVGSVFKFIPDDFSSYEILEITSITESNELILIFKNTLTNLLSQKIYSQKLNVYIVQKPTKINLEMAAQKESLEYLQFLKNFIKTN